MDKDFHPAQKDSCGRCRHNEQSPDFIHGIEAKQFSGDENLYAKMQKTRRLFPETPRFFIPH